MGKHMLFVIFDAPAVDVVAEICAEGGMDDAGSMVWADIHEFMDEDCLLPDTFQIVGHTQQYEPLWIGESVVCVDCRTVFRMVHGGKKSDVK